MKVDIDKYIGCGLCVPYCPAGAIAVTDKKAKIDQELCLECGNCIRKRTVNCPTDALYEPDETKSYPRNFRRFFSDPSVKTPSGLPGRGTEEVKTNDVTGRVCRGELGIAVEMGRPVLGTTMKDVEKMVKRLAKLGVHFESDNPLISLFKNDGSWEIKEELQGEKIVSLIIETKIPFNRGEEVLLAIKDMAKEIDTVFSLDVICCYDGDGTLPILPVLDRIGMPPRQNAKVNLGMGKPLKIIREE